MPDLKKMDRMIGEFIGLKPVRDTVSDLWTLIGNGQIHGYHAGLSEEHCWTVCCPEYTTNLNAMADAERFLREYPGDTFSDKHIANRYYNRLHQLHSELPPASASALTRASVFLSVVETMKST